MGWHSHLLRRSPGMVQNRRPALRHRCHSHNYFCIMAVRHNYDSEFAERNLFPTRIDFFGRPKFYLVVDLFLLKIKVLQKSDKIGPSISLIQKLCELLIFHGCVAPHSIVKSASPWALTLTLEFMPPGF